MTQSEPKAAGVKAMLTLRGGGRPNISVLYGGDSGGPGEAGRRLVAALRHADVTGAEAVNAAVVGLMRGCPVVPEGAWPVVAWLYVVDVDDMVFLLCCTEHAAVHEYGLDDLPGDRALRVYEAQHRAGLS